MRESFQDTLVFSVPFPKAGIDAFGSGTYKAFRDDEAVRAKMIGWDLTTLGLSVPASVRESIKAHEKEAKEAYLKKAS
eukprot:5028535-Prymnesium_polylepis.2